MNNMQVAQTILAQLGGNRFQAMTGASGFLGTEDSLMFKLPSKGKDGANKVRVTLTAMDDYIIETFYIRGASCRPCSFKTGVYADTLRNVFESVTGLRASL